MQTDISQIKYSSSQEDQIYSLLGLGTSQYSDFIFNEDYSPISAIMMKNNININNNKEEEEESEKNIFNDNNMYSENNINIYQSDSIEPQYSTTQPDQEDLQNQISNPDTNQKQTSLSKSLHSFISSSKLHNNVSSYSIYNEESTLTNFTAPIQQQSKKIKKQEKESKINRNQVSRLGEQALFITRLYFIFDEQHQENIDIFMDFYTEDKIESLLNMNNHRFLKQSQIDLIIENLQKFKDPIQRNLIFQTNNQKHTPRDLKCEIIGLPYTTINDYQRDIKKLYQVPDYLNGEFRQHTISQIRKLIKDNKYTAQKGISIQYILKKVPFE